MDGVSLVRYGNGSSQVRKYFIKLCAWLQRKPVLILDSDPVLCTKILACSDIKGTFVEHLFAIPAWQPIYSIESEDGMRWKELSMNCCQVFRTLRWKENIPLQVNSHIQMLASDMHLNPSLVIDAEQVSRIVLRVLYEILFEKKMELKDEILFYNASIEWRKEIALKGSGDLQVKQAFCQRLTEIIRDSRYGVGLIDDNIKDPTLWLSIFAQPFILSPQINVSDIMVSVFSFLREDPKLYEVTRKKVAEGDDTFLLALLMESIRLKHPFPILERELLTDMIINGKNVLAGTQVIMILDQFIQSPLFNPQSWLEPGLKHPFEGLVFGAGKRICLGKSLAKSLMVELLKSMLIYIPDIKIQPHLNHLYSGRDNDAKSSFMESIYQVKIFGRALWKSFKIGVNKASRV
ncbi:Cytochrome P450 [Legionella busanensis]|uniref:Cytochrome P450 n=1 Tax=Legionella busanensis TaxID=190655 RepID=A0A378JJ90_9GAMM|nr:cytochrome P450 [Legionella busanensis]STX50821.1 Cytochrome P450 [Legionella busanensis]